MNKYLATLFTITLFTNNFPYPYGVGKRKPETTKALAQQFKNQSIQETLERAESISVFYKKNKKQHEKVALLPEKSHTKTAVIERGCRTTRKYSGTHPNVPNFIIAYTYFLEDVSYKKINEEIAEPQNHRITYTQIGTQCGRSMYKNDRTDSELFWMNKVHDTINKSKS